MKNVLVTILLFALLPLTGIGQKSDLIVRTKQGQAFYLLINGSLQNETASNNVRVQKVRGDNRNITLIFEDSEFGFVNHNVPITPGSEMHYLVRRTRELVWTMRLEGQHPLGSGPLAPENQVLVQYLPKAYGLPGDQPPPPPAPPGPAGPPATTTTVVTTTTTTHPVADAFDPVDPGPVPGYNGQVGCTAPCTAERFAEMRGAVSSNTFENTKLRVAKQITQGNCLLASQVKQIMLTFDFENSRLDYAKFAYAFTYDQSNYFKVHSAFDFEFSIEKLNRELGL